jgi:hypothetical protein
VLTKVTWGNCAATGRVVRCRGIYRIENQQLPGLPAFASRRVRVEGTLKGDRIFVDNLTAVEAGADPSPERLQ